jgi:hypothetical protein
MGYTCGRRHTEESLREIAKQFKTRAEFQEKDSSAYQSARRMGKAFLDDVCSHMLSSYSTPQLICKNIMEKLLGMKCLYSTRKIITPYELDVYFPKFKLAIEYNGLGWHRSEDSIRRDEKKKELCDSKKINLIVIVENNRDYENDVKNQLIENLERINKATHNNFTEQDIKKINCTNIYDEIVKSKDMNDIETKISECESVKEFREKYISEYNFLKKIKKLKLLDKIRNRIEYSDEELIQKCKEIKDFSIFLKNHSNLYQRCKKRGLFDMATAHMDKTRRPYKSYTNDDLINLANKFKMKSHLKKKNKSLFSELIRRNILNLVTYDPNFIYTPHNKILKEIALKKCFDDAKKYNNYSDFKNDKELYKKCVNYKIVRKIIETFPKKDIREIIMEESEKYESFKDFAKSKWYLKTKKLPNLIGEIKTKNNWSFTTKDKINYIETFPEIVKMINDGVSLTEISSTTGKNKTTIWRVKKQMYYIGILKSKFNIRSDK